MASIMSRFADGWSRGASARALAVKAAVPPPVNATTVAQPFSRFFTPQEISARDAWLMYKTVAPFAKTVDVIADAVASLTPLVQINGRPIDGHPVKQFLDRPGRNRTRRRFMKEAAVQYLVTGTAYLHVIGNPAMGPLMLDILHSRFFSWFPGHDMWPDTYNYSEGMRSIQFRRDPNPRDFRWIDAASGLGELVPIYDLDGDYRGVGLSRLNAIRHDVELRLKGIDHNAAIMDNGARMSGVLSFKDTMTDEQKFAVQQQLKSSEARRGGVLLTAGGDMDFVALSQNAKDMDFAKLMGIVEDAIVARYNVPITLFRTDAQTNNNYETAWNILYDQAVLPTFQIIAQGMAQMFSERLGEPIEIVHDAMTSPILAKQAAQRAVQLFNAHLVSRNEARQLCGWEPVLGGDTIYGPMGEIPVAEDFFTGRDDGSGDMSREAYDMVRPKPDPTQADDDEPQAKPVDKKPKAEAEKAFGALLSFADAVASMQAKPQPHLRAV